MKITVERKVILTVAAFGVAVAMVVIIVIWPTIRAISAMNQDTFELRQYLEKKYAGAKELRPSLKKIAFVEGAVAHYPEHVLSHGDELALINALEKIATARGVTQKIATAGPESAPAATAHSSINLSLTSTGSYRNLLGYLSDLEHLSYFITIEQLALSPEEHDSPTTRSSPNLVLRLVVSLYVK